MTVSFAILNIKKTFNWCSPLQIAVLMLIAAQLGIYFYIPAFLQIANDFRVPLSSIELSLSAFLMSFGVAQFLIGLSADFLAVSKLTIVALCFFLIGSILCLLAQDSIFFIASRLVEGFGAGCLSTLARMHLKVLYSKESFGDKMATYAAAAVLVPALSPLLGSLVILLLPWQAIFAILVMYSLVAVLIYLKSTTNYPALHLHNGHISFYAIVKNLYILCSHRTFMTYGVLNAICYALFVLAIAFAPAILIREYGLSKQVFGVVMVLPPFGFLLGSYLMKKMRKHYKVSTLLYTGLCFILLAGILMGTSFFIANLSIAIIIIAFCLIPLGNGFIMAPLAAEACSLNLSPSIKGTDIALFGAMQILGASLLTGAIIMLTKNYFHVLAISSIVLVLIGLLLLAATANANKA